VTLKTSDRTILRIKDVQEQGPSRFVLLPGGLDRVIIACEYYEIVEGVITAYGPDGLEGGLLFSAPVASGYVLLDRTLCDTETVESSLRRMFDDEQTAKKLHKELYGHEVAADRGDLGDVSHLGLEPTARPGTLPTGQYL
jgi:hypothetical protein